MFDLSTIVEADTADLELRHPESNAALGVFFTLAGAGHPKRRKIEFARARAIRARVSKRGRLELTDPVEDEEYEIERLAACTTGWKGVMRDGKELPFSDAAAAEIYEGAAWIRRQVSAFLDDSANFIRNSGAN